MTAYGSGIRGSGPFHPSNHVRSSKRTLGDRARPFRNWVIVGTVLLLPVWSHVPLRSNVSGRLRRQGSFPCLVDDFAKAFRHATVPVIRKPANKLVFVEAVMGIRMARFAHSIG